MLTFQFINKSYRPFLSKTFLLQKVGTKFYIEQDPDLHFFWSQIWIRFFKRLDPDPVQNRLDPHHWLQRQ
jgi:hypothetical protein